MKNSNEPIRVAHIIGKWLGGGVEAVVMNYYKNINKSKIQFDFICDKDSASIPTEEIEKMGGKVILIPPYQNILEYQKILKKVLVEGHYKIVHSHINALSVFSLRAAKKAGVPIRIAHSHSTTNKKEWKKNLVKMLLRPFSKVYATEYFACTEHAGRWLFGNKELEKGNVYILNNAIDLNKFRYNELTRVKKRKELHIGDNDIVIGHVGRFVAQKNHEFIVDVFNEVHKQKNNSKLVLIGNGPLEEKVKKQISKYGLDNNVMLLGQRNGDIHELYQAMDVFLFPSLYEGLGIATIEAQDAGLRCICSTEVPKKVMVTDNVEFLSLDDSKKTWANAILKKSESPRNCNYKDIIGKNGFDIDYEVGKLQAKYEEYARRWEAL